MQMKESAIKKEMLSTETETCLDPTLVLQVSISPEYE